MQLTQAIPLVKSTTMREWLAAIARHVTSRLEGDTIALPTVTEIAANKLRDTKLALMDAEADAERAKHTVAMLKARAERLSALASGQ